MLKSFSACVSCCPANFLACQSRLGKRQQCLNRAGLSRITECPPLILRSGHWAASRRMRPFRGLMVRDARRRAPHHEGARRRDLLPHLCIPATRIAPELLCKSPSTTEGAGNAGCAVHTYSLACEMKKHTSVVTTGPPPSTGIPCAMVLTISFALSPVTGLCCHRRPRNISRKLDASIGASGPHDFAVRIGAVRQRAAKASIASRTQRP